MQHRNLVLVVSLASPFGLTALADAQVRVTPRDARAAQADSAIVALREAMEVQLRARHIQTRAIAAVRLEVLDAAAVELQAASMAQANEDRAVTGVVFDFAREPGLTRRVEWHPDDPADSLYRVAHGLFTKQEYRAAAERYAELRSRHADSHYFCDAAYYEAFSRYRLGTLADLRDAYGVLDATASRCASTERSQDVPELTARIDGALARLGDASAANRLRQAASQGQSICDREESNVKIAALSALAQMDEAAADPVLRGVLATRDECSLPVRRQAIRIVARRDDPGAVALLGQVARNETDRATQREAVRALGRLQNDASYGALESLLRESRDERVQAEVVSALARSDQPRAQAAVRDLIERRDVGERIRVAAISSLASRKPPPTADDWQSIYGRLESDELRKAVVNTVARSYAEEAQPFLLGVARDRAASPEVRATAVSRIRSTAPIPELYRLYETADSRSMRRSIVSGLSSRTEPAATDRLIDIARTSTDPDVRAAAIRALGQSPRNEDPKVVRALTAILACCEPDEW